MSPGQYSTGLYLFGAPGTAKTHTVRAVLDEIREIYTYQRGHLTPMGLFELLREHRNEVIVLDDLAAIFNSPTALQLLLAALEHSTSRDFGRQIEYRRQGGSESFSFRGGVICISNLELHDSELLNAFKSRVHVLNYAPTNEQLGRSCLTSPAAAGLPERRPRRSSRPRPVTWPAMSSPSCSGWGAASTSACWWARRSRTFQQWKDGETETDWRELVTASIEEHLAATAPAVPDPVPGKPKGRGATLSRTSCERMSAGRIVSGSGWSGQGNRSGRSTGGWRKLTLAESVKVSICQKTGTRGGAKNRPTMAGAVMTNWPARRCRCA